MTIVPRRVRVLIVCLACLASGWWNHREPHAQSASYRLVTMTSGQGPGGPAADVSDSGIVVGYRLGTGGGYRWTEATGLLPIGDATVQALFPYYNFFPPQLGTNDSGVVVGVGIPPGGGIPGAAKWSSSTGYALLGTAQIGQAARAVNAAGVIVGLFHGNAQRPFIWRQASGMQYLSGFDVTGSGDAFDINDSDVVVGRAGGSTCGSGVQSAFTWTEAGGVVCLPLVYAGAYHEALAISNNGLVVGRFEASASTPAGAFLWSVATGTVNLNVPAGQVFFMDVNDAGDVVATIVPPGGGTNIPYLYQRGTWTNINTLLPPASSVVLKTVTGINASGWMVGEAAPSSNPNSSGIGWLLIPPSATVTSITSSPNPSPFGAPAAFTATVRSGVAAVTTGTVTFREGATVLAGPLDLSASGQAGFTTATLAAGTHLIEARFSGAPGFLPSTASVSHAVSVAAPTSQDDGYTTTFNTALTIASPGVLANDATNGGGIMTATVQTDVAHGSLMLAASGGFTYTPSPGFAGADTFTYRATNAAGAGNTAAITITVLQPTTPQPPSGLYVSSMKGNLVTFRWRPPDFGPAPEQFVLSGGLVPGEVIAALPTASRFPIFAVTVPDGAYYTRVQTVANGSTSQPSDEVRIFVNTATAPSAPADIVGLVNGSSLLLAWRNTFGGAAPTSTLLDVTGAAAATLPLAVAETFMFAPVPGGTYTFSVRAANAGGVSGPSPLVTLSFPGACSGIPLPPANALAYRVGNTIFVVWDPAATGPAPSAFVLSVSGSYVGTVTTAQRAVNGTVGPGSYGFSVRASNACGTSSGTPVQTVTVP